MSFDEAFERALRTVLQDEVIMRGPFDDLVAFDDVGVVQVLMDVHLLLE